MSVVAAAELTLIRHGATEANALCRYPGWEDARLSRAGRRQAVAVGRSLGSAFDALWCSDLRRAVETARIAFPDLSPRMDARLRELDFGVFASATHEENLDRHGDIYRSWIENSGDARPPGGESLDELAARVRSWWDDALRPGRIVVVAHEGTLAMIAAIALSIPWSRARRARIPTGGWNVLTVHAAAAGSRRAQS